MKKFLIVLILLPLIIMDCFGQGRPKVTILLPANNSTVPQLHNTIEFLPVVSLPTGMQPVVFVMDPSGQYWPYREAKHVPGTNKWVIQNVQYGVKDDTGQNFEITVIFLNRYRIQSTNPFAIQNNHPITDINDFNDLKSSSNLFSATVIVIRR